MESATSYDLQRSFTALIQGPPGSGKTSLALQFPKPYVCDLDNNLSGTIRWMRKNKLDLNFKFDIPDLMPDPKDEKRSIIRPIKERYGFMSKCLTIAEEDSEIDTIIVDGATKLNSYIIGDIGRQAGRKDGEMQLQDWNAHMYMWQNFITKMQATSKMFILTAHEEYSDIPNLPGAMLINIQGKKIQQSLAGMFSDVWRTEIKDELKGTGREYKRLVRTMQTSSLQLKNSLSLPDTFVSDWKTIAEALKS